jgi:hypothetical protein
MGVLFQTCTHIAVEDGTEETASALSSGVFGHFGLQRMEELTPGHIFPAFMQAQWHWERNTVAM